jgi:phosphosulfolactate phosphohydrolase-like enzyme
MRTTIVRFELGVAGATRASQRGDVIVVVDALRASSTIVTALATGLRSVRPVADVDECVGEVTAGERGGAKVARLDYDNSPLAFLDRGLIGKDLVLTTTNGTACLVAAASHRPPAVFVGALLNATAAGRTAQQAAVEALADVSIVMAGRRAGMATEDLIVATEIRAAMTNTKLEGDFAPTVSTDFESDFLQSDSGRNLLSLGREPDVRFCARKDVFGIVPRWVEEGRLVVEQVTSSRRRGS